MNLNSISDSQTVSLALNPQEKASSALCITLIVVTRLHGVCRCSAQVDDRLVFKCCMAWHQCYSSCHGRSTAGEAGCVCQCMFVPPVSDHKAAGTHLPGAGCHTQPQSDDTALRFVSVRSICLAKVTSAINRAASLLIVLPYIMVLFV